MNNVWSRSSSSQPRDRKVTVLVVGQVPPPVNGQSMMISAFLEGEYASLNLVYVPMRFSRSTSEIGSFSVRKLFLLFVTLIQIIAARLTTGATIIYYPPAGANLVPVLRDLVLLVPTRILFRYTVFHFHAAGLTKIYSRLPKILRLLFLTAYDRPDLAIFTTAATSAEAVRLHAKNMVIIPCGIPDQSKRIQHGPLADTEPSILFAGILCEEKGVMVLLEACQRLLATGVRFRLTCIGAFQSKEFEERVRAMLEATGLAPCVKFPGVITGEFKDELFSTTDIFCFPSYYPAESFGVVLIEAMSFSLPIVATDWQGIPEVVGRVKDGSDSAGALLVPPQDPDALAQALTQLLLSPLKRAVMGEHNRTRYLQNYTLASYRARLEDAMMGLSAKETEVSRLQATSDVLDTHSTRLTKQSQWPGIDL